MHAKLRGVATTARNVGSDSATLPSSLRHAAEGSVSVTAVVAVLAPVPSGTKPAPAYSSELAGVMASRIFGMTMFGTA